MNGLENEPGGGGTPPPASDSVARLAELEAAIAERDQQLARANGILETLNPHADLIQELVKDAELRELFTQTKAGREAFRQSNKKPIPEELQPLYEKLDGVVGFVEELKGREKTQTEAAENERRTKTQEWQNSASAYISSLAKDVPAYFTGKKFKDGDVELTDDGWIMANSVGAFAQKNGITFEEAYKRIGDRFVPRGGGTPPPSLPVDAANQGIPTAKQPGADAPIDFVAELERRMGVA